MKKNHYERPLNIAVFKGLSQLCLPLKQAGIGALSEIPCRFNLLFVIYCVFMDTLTKPQRHTNMAAIHSKDTTPELAVRSALHGLGFRFRKNDARLPGHPDVVFPHYHAIIFVNGCFWHGHVPYALSKIVLGKTKKLKNVAYKACPCVKYHLPKSNTDFWRKKIRRNRERDADEMKQLINDGWRVGVVWECEITGKGRAVKIRDMAERISLWLEEEFDEQFKEF